jgi:hypothetical protein
MALRPGTGLALSMLLVGLGSMACGAGEHQRAASSRLVRAGDMLDLVPDGRSPLLWVGNEIVFFETSTGIVATDLEGRILIHAGPLTSRSAWALSPDARELVYALPAGVYRAALDGSSPTVLVQRKDVQYVHWTQDGRYVIYTDREGTYAIPREGGTSGPYLPEQEAKGSYSVVIPPGGLLPNPAPERPLGEALWVHIDPDSDYGSWKAWEDGRLVIRSHLHLNETCRPFVLSPNGRLAACTHVITNILDETSEGWGAVMAIRPASS